MFSEGLGVTQEVLATVSLRMTRGQAFVVFFPCEMPKVGFYRG